MEREEAIDECIELYNTERHRFKMFSDQVKIFFTENENLNKSPLPILHSLKSRVKDVDHLRDKLRRQWDKGNNVNKDTFFNGITDLAGVRVLHMHQEQFPAIHEEIINNIDKYHEWVLVETPKAYIWDKEKESIYKNLNINVQTKDSNYTSIHYVIKPNKESFVKCEIQVRTLFEEIWGEIDHTINYPHKTKSIACQEQIKVLAKLVNAGTRLADSIFASFNEFNNK
ncbi:MAG: (p)ppGpp synthetase [Janthinobacterium lividum]